MPASVRTLSQLPGITSQELNEKSKLEVSIPVELSINGNERLYKFASRSITAGALSEKIQRDMRYDLEESNGLSSGMRVDDLSLYVSAIANNDFTFRGEKTFVKDPLIDNSPLSDYDANSSGLDDYSVNFETLKKYSAINSAPAIGPNFGFVTRLSGFHNGTDETERILTIFKPDRISGEWKFENVPYFVFNENAKNVVPEEYIFKIEPGERESKPWKAPASGIFTCYGWLDEMHNPAESNESRWVALMGKQAQIGDPNGWTVLQVQPFNKNSYISYVGFTFPVKKGMELKIMTGFAVGRNSDKYSASNSSIANHVGNAFLGGVYTGLSAYNEMGGNYDMDLDTGFATFEDLQSISDEIMQHEHACDTSADAKVDSISSVLSGAVDFLSAEIDKIPRGTTTAKAYVDPWKWSSGNPDRGGCTSRSLIFGPNQPSKYYGNGNENYSYFYYGNANANKKKGIEREFHTYREIDRTVYDSWVNDPTYHDKLSVISNTCYQKIDGPDGHGGNWFYTDDWFWYYTTPYDGLVYVSLNPDYADATDLGAQCYLKYVTGNPQRTAFKLLASAVEYGGSGDTRANVSIPLKKGSTLAFAAYVRRRTKESNTHAINLNGAGSYSEAKYKKTVKATKGQAAQGSASASKTWSNFATLSIPLLSGVSSSRVMSIDEATLHAVTIRVKQTTGKSNVYFRLMQDNGTQIGQVQTYDANSTKQGNTVKLTWFGGDESRKFQTPIGEHLNIQIAHGVPAQDTTTQIWVSYFKTVTKYTGTPYSKNIIGAPVPSFNGEYVDSLSSAWQPGSKGTQSGQIVKPHEYPSWLDVTSDRILASVSIMGLTP